MIGVTNKSSDRSETPILQIRFIGSRKYKFHNNWTQ